MESVQILEGTYGGPKMRIAYVVPNPATLKGMPVGFFAEELTKPFSEFVDAGHEVEIFSPEGGNVAFDFFSDPENEATIYPNDL